MAFTCSRASITLDDKSLFSSVINISPVLTVSPERTFILSILASNLDEIIVACFAVILAATPSNIASELAFTV